MTGDIGMDKLKLLKHIADLYSKDINIINYLKNIDSSAQNSVEDIMISYDFQAGSYVKMYEDNRDFSEKYTDAIANVINALQCTKSSIFECGVGEATTLVPLSKKLDGSYDFIGGNDISWSRIAIAQKFAKEHCVQANLVVANMFNLPLADNSIDVVYTSHSLEPNGGHERELLRELYRVSNEYLILLEPAYELADDNAKARMKEHGYVTGLYETAKELGYDIEEYRLFDICSNPLNPTGLMVIKKHAGNEKSATRFCCPLTYAPLEKKGSVYYASKALLSYPIMNGVPMLLKEQAIVTTKMNCLDI